MATYQYYGKLELYNLETKLHFNYILTSSLFWQNYTLKKLLNTQEALQSIHIAYERLKTREITIQINANKVTAQSDRLTTHKNQHNNYS